LEKAKGEEYEPTASLPWMCNLQRLWKFENALLVWAKLSVAA
jgi:hypothetical protein